MTTIECHCLHLGESWLIAGIRTSSQQSEHEDDNYALYTTPAVGWANGSIVNPTLMSSSVDCEKYAANLHRYLSCLKWVADLTKENTIANTIILASAHSTFSGGR